jgi:hypothetical protein
MYNTISALRLVFQASQSSPKARKPCQETGRSKCSSKVSGLLSPFEMAQKRSRTVTYFLTAASEWTKYVSLIQTDKSFVDTPQLELEAFELFGEVSIENESSD